MSQLTSLIRKFLPRASASHAASVRAARSFDADAILSKFDKSGVRVCKSFDTSRLRFPEASLTDFEKLPSAFATKAQLTSPAFKFWCRQMRQSWHCHRKLWEFCYIVQTLYERDMLRTGRRGLGFAVGEEPLPSLFASLGCEITATDLESQDPRAQVWADSNQLAAGLAVLNNRGICPVEAFGQLVSFQPVDMNKIPDQLDGYDFSWSSCSFEHCGSIDLGCEFIINQMRCLKPGGVAVHTTEFNLTSNEETVTEGSTVVFRQRDIARIMKELQAQGHRVEPLLLDVGDSAEDRHIDHFPYSSDPHLKLTLYDRYVSTSIGLIIQKAA